MALKMLSLPVLKDYIKLTSDAADSNLTALGEDVEAWLENRLGVSLAPRNVVDERVRGGGRLLRVLVHPVTDVTAVKVSIPYGVEDVSAEEYEASEYGVERLASWPLWDYYEYKVTYTAGYANAAACPAELRLLAMQLIAKVYRNQDDHASESSKGGGLTWNDHLNEFQRMILDDCSYQRVF